MIKLKQILNEGGVVKINDTYIDSVMSKIEPYLRENFMRYVLLTHFKALVYGDTSFIKFIKEVGIYDKLVASSDMIKYNFLHKTAKFYIDKLVSYVNELNNTNFTLHESDFNINIIPSKLQVNIDFINNPLKNSVIFNKSLQLTKDIPDNYYKYIKKVSPELENGYIKLTYQIYNKIAQEKMAVRETNNYNEFIIEIYLLMFVRESDNIDACIEDIKYTLKHELTHVLQFYGDFGKNRKHSPHYENDIDYLYGKLDKSKRTIGKYREMRDDFKKISIKKLKDIYEISIREYKAKLYSLVYKYFKKYKIPTNKYIDEFIKANSYFKKIAINYGSKEAVRAKSDFYNIIHKEYEKINKK